jgi:uncharacterized protein (TIGR02996 family)
VKIGHAADDGAPGEVKGEEVMTATETGLLAAVRAAPDDDLPRLVMADWLEENGRGDRAEFVRLQCEIERTGARSSADCSMMPDNTCSGFNGAMRHIDPGAFEGWCPACLPKVRLLEREQELLKRHLGWLDRTRYPILNANGSVSIGSDGLMGPPICHTFRRGFVESVTCPAAAWLARGDAVLAAHPVRRVTLTTLPAYFYRDAAGGWVEQDDEFWTTAGEAQAAVEARWPGVAFELPPERRGRVVTLPPGWPVTDVPESDYEGMRELGRLMAMAREEAFLRAFLDGAS